MSADWVVSDACAIVLQLCPYRHFVCACSAENTAGMRLLCVYANRKMAVVLTTFSAMFPFVTCVKESENQPNGFVESRRKFQPSPF